MATTAAVLRLDAKNLVGASLLTAVIPPGDRRIKKTVLFSMALLYHASSLMGWRKLFWLPKEHTFSKNTRSQSGPSKAVEGLKAEMSSMGSETTAQRAPGRSQQQSSAMALDPNHLSELDIKSIFKQLGALNKCAA